MPRNSTMWKLAGTETFRLSSAAILGKYGTNLQNPSDDICKLYIPDNGKVFVQVDQAGAEALIVAYLCPLGNYRSLFLNSVKPHVFVALHVFCEQFKRKAPHLASLIDAAISTSIPDLKNLPNWKELDALIKHSDTWSAQERYYFIAKMIVHASSYGMKGPTFQMNVLQKSEGKIVLTLKEANRYLTHFHTLFPEIGSWQIETQTMLQETRTLYNLFGFPRYFSGPINDKTFKEGYAFVPQSTVGTITNYAYVEAQDWIEHNPEAECDMLNNKHDSVMGQCLVGEELVFGQMLKFLMERPLVNSRGERFNMKAEVSAGMNWAKYKESNPEGMKEIKV